jgi:hypothetical protein
MMNKKKICIFTGLVVIVVLLMPASIVLATKPTPVLGAFWVTPTIISTPPYILELSIRPLGENGNAILTWTDLPVTFVGTISGTGLYNAHVLKKSDGTINAHGIVTLTNAWVGSNMGDLTIKMETYNWRIISGTGGLENLHGCGTVIWTSTEGLYLLDGQIHFDP